METQEEFYVFYPSNCETDLYTDTNSSSKFSIIQSEPFLFEDPTKWQVGLSEIFIPSTHYNIYPPFNENVFVLKKFAVDQGDLTGVHKIRVGGSGNDNDEEEEKIERPVS